MGTLPLQRQDFTIDLSYTYDVSDKSAYVAHIRDALDRALRAALDIPPQATPYTPAMSMSHQNLVDGAQYTGHLRLNGVHKRTKAGVSLESVSYSFIICDGETIVGWSSDLDQRYTCKASWSWFKLGSQHLVMTGAQRAAIKAMVPKRPLGKKTP
jgi:hypothetical protein